MSHRIRPGLGLALIRPVLRLLAFALRPFIAVRRAHRTPAPAVREPEPEPVHVPRPSEPPQDDPAPACPLEYPSRRLRPYLTAHEQYSRRLALALALDGIDIGPRVIHGRLVGAGVPAGVAV